MPKEDVELSGRMPAFITWMQTIGLILFILSQLVFTELDWLFYIGSALIIGAIICRLYVDWKAGRKKAFRTRLFMLIGVIAICLILLLIFGNRYNT